jgi:D-lactate dehydrogenase (cytochrome)
MLNDDLLKSLASLLGSHKLITDPVELLTYEFDAGLNRGTPDGVAFPESHEDVMRLVRWAAEHHIPLVARAAGTGLSGGAVPARGGIVVSFSRMDRILALDETDRLAVVEPGVINLALDTELKKRGFYYPPDPASQRASAIGGNIAENAGGPHCFKYGVTTNYVRGLELVLADGTTVRTGGGALQAPEFDFTGLLCGSEGTLAIITSAWLGFIRNSSGVKTLIATFDSVEQAGRAVSAVIARGLVPAALEMMDRNILRIIEDFAHAGLPTEAEALLLAEVDGHPQSLGAQIEEIEQVFNEHQVRHLQVCQTADERNRIWFARKSAFGAMARISPAYFQVDGTVPRSRLAETLADINRICASLDLKVGYVFHAGDGNLHPLMPFDPKDRDMERRVHEAGDAIMATCVSKGGTISGEHGVGIEKRKYMPLMFTPDELSAMHEIKEIFDPEGMFNPGKIFPDKFVPVAPQPSKLGVDPLPPIFTPASEKQAADGLKAAQLLSQKVLIHHPHKDVPDQATILSTVNFREIATLSPEDLYVEVGAGMKLADLQAELSRQGLGVPIASPWRQEATIGGMVSAAADSPLQVRYGPIRNQVLGMNVILPDGRHLRLGRPVIKNVAGYDLTKLFIGAHGTLGLITKVMLKLTALPRARRSLIVPVQDLETGLRLGESLCRRNLIASAILLCPGALVPKALPAPFNIIYTAEGYEQDVEAELKAVRTMTEGVELDEFTGVDVWEQALHGAKTHLRAGVSPAKLPQFIGRHATDLGGSFILDIANGMTYAFPVSTPRALAMRKTALTLDGYVVVVDPTGTIGIDPWGYRPQVLPLMRRLKDRWDPKGILNPGVFLV